MGDCFACVKAEGCACDGAHDDALHVTRDSSIACDSPLKVVWRRFLIAYLVVFGVYFAAAFVFFKYTNPWHYNRIYLRDYNRIFPSRLLPHLP